jgi:hypothetical protein
MIPQILDKKAANREEAIILSTLKETSDQSAGKWHNTVKSLRGISEESTREYTGLYQMLGKMNCWYLQ